MICILLGFVSIVSDTWDFWNVIENFLPKLKKDIMARDGRVVIRPDSGDPVDIICGLRTNPHFNTRIKEGKYYCCYAPFNDDAEYVEVSEGQYYGAYYMLGKIFGWHEALSRITGFGSLRNCCLCNECGYEAGDPDCTGCLYSWNKDNVNKFSVPCINQYTYCAIYIAESLDELYEAIQNRADFIENLIKEIENDN